MKDLNNKHRSCRTHCCVIHGCKYGHEDCPVVIGKIKQEYQCEGCQEWYPVIEETTMEDINKEFLRLNRKLKLDEIKK